MKLKNLLPPKVRLVFEAARFWRKHEIGKRILGTRESKEQTSEGIEYEGDDMKFLEKLRTSTKMTLAGGISYAVLTLLGHFAPEFPTVGLEEWIAAVVTYVAARLSKTPETPGVV